MKEVKIYSEKLSKEIKIKLSQFFTDNNEILENKNEKIN